MALAVWLGQQLVQQQLLGELQRLHMHTDRSTDKPDQAG
jgi:hypothetical protein